MCSLLSYEKAVICGKTISQEKIWNNASIPETLPHSPESEHPPFHTYDDRHADLHGFQVAFLYNVPPKNALLFTIV